MLYKGTMSWAACYTGFFGFLYFGEFSCPSSTAIFSPYYQFPMLQWLSPQHRRPKCLPITSVALWRLFRVRSCPPVSYNRIMWCSFPLGQQAFVIRHHSSVPKFSSIHPDCFWSLRSFTLFLSTEVASMEA